MKMHIFFAAIATWLALALAPLASAATVTWTGGGDGVSWSDPNNWSTKALPGSTADVTIGTISGNPTIQITAAAGTVRIHSLNSNEPVSISNGSLTLASASKINAQLSVSGASSMLNVTALTALLADNILVDNGAQVSFPNVTTYAVPAGVSVQWIAQSSSGNAGTTLNFPNLTTITGPASPNTYFDLIAQYNNGATLSLPALTTITKADDGDAYTDSGVRFTASQATISAPKLATFNDNDSHPNSSLTANNTGVLSIPKLLAPKGININLDAQSNPQQFTSLVGTSSFEVNSGTVAMTNLASITSFTSIIADYGAQLSFPNVTSYAVPPGLSVQWISQSSNGNQGTTLSFPNLTTITGPASPNTYFDLISQYNNGATLSLPALTTITKADDGDTYADSGVRFTASQATISAPKLATFSDNDSHPNSSLTANNTGVLSIPKLLAPKGVNINLNALSNPQQFTSLVGTSSFEINSGTVAMSNLASITSFSSIIADYGAQLSFPNVTSYAVPAGLSVQWIAQSSNGNQGTVLSFPNLTTITGPASPNTYFDLIAQYNNGATLSLPALTTITKADDGDAYADSGVRFTASAATISAPNLTTFNDNDSHSNSSLTANSGGVLSIPKLLAPKGVNINLDAQSDPQQFTSLVGTSSFEVNSGTVTMNNLSSVTGFTSIIADYGAQLSFPKVTSYAVPAGLSVQWIAQSSNGNQGTVLIFPNLTTITGPASPNTYFDLIAQYNNGATLSLPATTSVTKANDGDAYADSGVRFTASAATISAPNLTTFNDNDSHPNSSLSANSAGVLSIPKLLAPKGVNINLDAQSNPQQFTSLVGTSSFEVNSGTVAMSSLASITGFTSIVADYGAQLSFPNVASYAVPAGLSVQWIAQSSNGNQGTTLSFPNLTTIMGPATPNTYFDLIAQYNNGATLSLPALATITKADDGDAYADSGVRFTASNATISAPDLTTFDDNDSHPNSSITANSGGDVSVDNLTNVIGVSINFGYALTINAGQSYIGYGTIQDGVFNAGLLANNSPGQTLQINGPLSSTGTVRVTNGATLSIAGDFTLDGTGLLSLSAGSTLAVTGDFLGTTTNVTGTDPLGTLLLNGTRSSLNPQHLEAMSQDLGAVAAGFTQNFAFGTLSLANNTYVQLVDRSRNTTSTSKECVYAESVIIPAGCTLDLNGLHLYARAVQNGGTVLNGSITQIPNAGVLALETATPGDLVTAGELDEWTFFFQAGRSVSVFVNPGANGFAAPVSPQLQWANVQLLDSSNNVLASGFSANAGDIVALQNIVIPADGTYKIHVNAPAAHTAATGNYTVGAWDSTPDIRSLTLDQQVTGNVATSFAVDQWTFSAVAGQQIQFLPASADTPGIAFTLNGPGGYTAFTGISANSMLIDLPTSGSYTLNAYGVNGATGGYGFVINQTSVTPLAVNATYNGKWAGSGQAQLFMVPVTAVNPLLVVLSDAASTDHTEIYARFGAAPTRQTFDYAANGPGSNHSLLVPSAAVGSWYVLVYGESIPSSSGTYALQAKAQEVFLSGNSTGQSASNINTSITLTGAGFTSATKVSFISTGGTSYAATSSATDLPTQIMATVAAGTLPAGTYGIEVTQPDGSTSELPSSIIIAATGQGILQTHIDIPNPIGRHIASTLYVTYSNVGDAPMPAPLLNVYATNPSGVPGAFLTLDPALITSGFWTSATPLGYSQSVQILASGATPGVLQPGETEQMPVYYGGWINSLWSTSGTFDFYVAPVQADDTTPVDWASLESSTQPASISAAAWHIVYANLLSQLGTTSGGYVQLLDKNAIYLGELGRNVVDISKLWSFAITQALDVFPTQDLAGTTDDSLPTVGKLFLSFGRAFRNSIPGRFQSGPFGLGWVTPWQRSLSVAADSTVTIGIGNGSKSIYQPDSRYAGQYFSQAGDHSTLRAVSGGYQLTSVDGTVALFLSTGQLSYLQDPNGNKISATYTGSNLTGVAASSGPSFTIAYNGTGLISTLTDSVGRVTRYTYDAAHQYLMSVLSYNGQTTSYAYDTTPGSASLNALTTINLPSGLQENLAYDGSGRPTEITSNDGSARKTVAYSMGQVSITDATPATSSVYFDENGQLAKTVDALGNPTFFGHDSNYNLNSVTNALGISATYTHNNFGQMTTATDCIGNTTYLTYGAPQNRLTKLVDAKGNSTSYTYNPTGQRTAATFANGNSESSAFDALGNALSFVTAAGEPIQYTHYPNGQLKIVTFADGSSYTYVYDGDGHLTSATDALGAVTFTYDPMTRLLSKVTYPDGLWLAFTYDANDRRSSMTDQTGSVTNYSYDSLSRLSALKDGSGNVIVSYSYDSNGRLDKKTNGNGTYTTYLYDANGQVQHLINYAPGGAVNSRFDDTFNTLGLKTSEVTLDGSWTYTYDGDGQLTHSVFATKNAGKIANQELIYDYDAVGNRASTVINGVTTVYVSNNMNQYSSIGGVGRNYDANGNLIFDGSESYAYDTLNHLVRSAKNTSVTTHVYNSLGQRTSTSTGGQPVDFLIDPQAAGNVVGAFDQSGNVEADYIYGFGLTAQRAGSTVFNYDGDVLGSIVGITNQSGSYVNAYGYLPFGNKSYSSEAILNPFKFSGTYGVTEDDDGHNFMRTREFDSSSGCFASQDPLRGSIAESNQYLYAVNSPVNAIDPTGCWYANVMTPIPFTYFGVGRDTGTGRQYVGFGASVGIGGYGTISNPASGFDGFQTMFGGYSSGNPPASGFTGGGSTVVMVGGGGDVDQSGSTTFGAMGFGGDLHGGYGWDHEPDGDNNVGTYFGNGGGDSGGGDDSGGLPSFPFPFPLPDPDPLDPDPLPPVPFPPTPPGPTTPGQPDDPNSLNGPAGYGAENFVANMGNAFAYRVTFENDPTANAPAQIVTITDDLSSSLNWSSFQLTGMGFADNNFIVPPGSQHYETTISMTYNGQTFNVQIEAGIHSDTGQVYATFESIDPNTSLPPSNVLTGFLPPEDGTGRGEGYLTYTVAPSSTVSNATVIRNVANITFDGNQPIATDQVDDDDASKGTDPTKTAPVTIDSTVPTSRVTALPAHVSPNIAVSWSGSDPNGSGIASYTVYVSTDGGKTYTAWLINTQLTSDVYQGIAGHSYTFYVVATNNVGTVQTNGTAGAVSTYVDYPPQITSAVTDEVMMGQPFSYEITASNTPTGFAATGLPGGLSVNATNGLISGTPSEIGVFPITLSASNDGGTGNAILTLTVTAPPVTYPIITSVKAATVVLGQSFRYQITATNTPESFGATGLPPGLSLNTIDGVISGVPTKTGIFNVSLSAENAGGTGTGILTLTVSPVPVVPPAITSLLAVNAAETVPFSYQIVATGMPSVYGASGLPAGLGVNAAIGLISGTPAEKGTFSVELSAGNSGGTGTAALILTVDSLPVLFPEITSAGDDGALPDRPFDYQIAATNLPTSFGASGLPPGLSVNASTGLISGTPTETGIFRIGLNATNASGTGTASLTLTVSADAVVVPVITSVLKANGQATVAFHYQITADNDPVSFDATPLPDGLTLNAASGRISGKPEKPGKYSITIGAANAAGTGTEQLELVVAPAPLPTVNVEVPKPEIKIGTGAVGEFTLTLSKVLHANVTVHYALRGTAVNGEDYKRLNGIAKIKAGAKKVTIKVVPIGDLGGAPEKTVRFVLDSGKGYTIKTPEKPDKIKLVAKP